MLTFLISVQTGQAIGRIDNNSVTGMVRTQLIAHDKEVFDIAFSRAGGGRDIFASVGADGSVRMFDLRFVTKDGMLLMLLLSISFHLKP